jgi:hypothetical protein
LKEDSDECCHLGLIGVVVGAAILTVRDYFLAAKKEAADKKRKRAEKFEEFVTALYDYDRWMESFKRHEIHGTEASTVKGFIARIHVREKKEG